MVGNILFNPPAHTKKATPNNHRNYCARLYSSDIIHNVRFGSASRSNSNNALNKSSSMEHTFARVCMSHLGTSEIAASCEGGACIATTKLDVVVARFGAVLLSCNDDGNMTACH